MGGLFYSLVIAACVVALVALFFPFRFRIEFLGNERGAQALFFFFRKKLGVWEKKWKTEDEGADGEPQESIKGISEDSANDEDSEPAFVNTRQVKKDSPAEQPVEAVSKAASGTVEKSVSPVTEKNALESETHADNPKPGIDRPGKGCSDGKPTEAKKEKRKLSDREFWTIILTPDLDERAFRYLKKTMALLVRIFNMKFVDCFVEGIRADYETMGYGAAVNGFLKGFPYIGSWDFRMDWCGDRDLHVEGKIFATANLCRVLTFLLVFVVYALILLILFYRRRSRVFKTNELPELGFFRKKILNFMVEE